MCILYYKKSLMSSTFLFFYDPRSFCTLPCHHDLVIHLRRKHYSLVAISFITVLFDVTVVIKECYKAIFKFTTVIQYHNFRAVVIKLYCIHYIRISSYMSEYSLCFERSPRSLDMKNSFMDAKIFFI